MIPPSEIARLAHRLGLGDKIVEKDYVLTWVLLAIANSPLRDLLAFKGGTAIKRSTNLTTAFPKTSTFRSSAKCRMKP